MPRPSSEGIRVVLCLFLVLFLGVADNQVISPLLPALRRQFGKTSQEVGLLFTVYSLAAGFSVLIWGPLSDVFGRHAGLVTGLLSFLTGSVISLFSESFLSLMIGRMVTGSAASLLSLNTISYAADYFPYETRGWAMGSIFSSYFAALILGVPIGSLTADSFGWNSVFALTGGTSIALLLMIHLMLPKLRWRSWSGLTELSGQGILRTYLDFFYSPKTVGALLASLSASAGMMGFLAFVGIWLSDAFAVSAKQIGLVFLGSGAAALVAAPFGGALSDRVGKRRQFIASNAVLAALLFVLPRFEWGMTLLGVFGGVAVASAFRQGPMEALISEVVPMERRGTFIALKNCFSQMGIALAAAAGGFLYQHFGYLAVCSLSALMNLLAAFWVLLLPRQSRL